MALCTQRQVGKLNLLYEAHCGASTLQNFDAILRNDYFAADMSWRPRFILWILLLLPLVLGAAYKKFSGGSTDLVIHGPDVAFGTTAAPGYQLIGNGLSLLPTVYLPFWMKPATNRTYGFNLYIPNDSTAAILDAPLPTNLTSLHTSLLNDQSMTITAKVNATVTENIDPSGSERNNVNYWQSVQDSYPTGGRMELTDVGALNSGIWGGRESLKDWSVIYLSRWNTGENQTFQSQAERFITTRRTCIGTWNITRNNASLIHVLGLESGVGDGESQTVIRNNILTIGTMFFQFMGEYDWTNRQGWNQPLPDSSPTDPKFIPTINTRPALVAAMLWSRIVSLDGPERWTNGHSPFPELAYRIQSQDIRFVKSSRTLRRSSGLMVLLLINPILTVAAVLMKALLYGTPLSDDFGLISLLAAVRENVVAKLRGASLSGKLRQEMKLRFMDRGDQDRDRWRRLELEVGEEEKGDLLISGKCYG
ncbi:MAG: hypothetical protein LQ352_003026 [Teloschistes flavicans]|nr:MAG: hypothetical protein LQ352_003026 [Teloschistes flavicans]